MHWVIDLPKNLRFIAATRKDYSRLINKNKYKNLVCHFRMFSIHLLWFMQYKASFLSVDNNIFSNAFKCYIYSVTYHITIHIMPHNAPVINLFCINLIGEGKAGYLGKKIPKLDWREDFPQLLQHHARGKYT